MMKNREKSTKIRFYKVNAPVISILIAVIGTQIISHFIELSLILTIFYNPCCKILQLKLFFIILSNFKSKMTITGSFTLPIIMD